ncbi:hypothetical protein B0H17DRAFT_1242008 [Mycena rosella]|uniref:Asl1-like glycosyl hydrolase catalytic domain-containing protein n=1 Tax=Mycena rosella TaxID=1033263 RepID=A0AAD7DXR4_MYCRO|nr:hypothetical protein B0H17DRAFT_1242008 [Mycena rosella]
MALALKFVVLIQCLLSATSVGGSNPKRGLAVVQGSESDLGKVSGSECSWFYNWSPTPATSAPVGIAFVPMQWGRENVAEFADTVRRAGAKTIVGFNEPDMPAPQSNIPPEEAAQLWQQHIQPLKSAGVRLGSPALSSAPGGLPWLSAFMKACNGCTIDFIVVHWCVFGSHHEDFYLSGDQYLVGVHRQFPQHPIWVTEFAETSGNAAEGATFMAAVLKYLDDPAQSWIERYSWFAYAVREYSPCKDHSE